MGAAFFCGFLDYGTGGPDPGPGPQRLGALHGACPLGSAWPPGQPQAEGSSGTSAAGILAAASRSPQAASVRCQCQRQPEPGGSAQPGATGRCARPVPVTRTRTRRGPLTEAGTGSHWQTVTRTHGT